MSLRDPSFQALYPTPQQLIEPLFNGLPNDYPYSYDVFANHHITVNGMSACIRRVGNRYLVSCRGYLPDFSQELKVRMDKGWTNLYSTPHFDLAYRRFLSVASELVSMPRKYRLNFQSIEVVDYHALQSQNTS